MTNHYTSYEVSKALWEAGIAFEHNRFYDVNDIERAVWTGKGVLGIGNRIPAYTAGELLRELQKEANTRSDSVALQTYTLYINYLLFGVEDDIAELDLGCCRSPEDTLGLALIEIKTSDQKSSHKDS